MKTQTEKQKERLHKTFSRAFLTSTAVTLLSATFALYTDYNLRDGGNWDLKARINDEMIQNVIKEHPGYTESRARNHLLNNIDETKQTIKDFGRNNTLLLMGISGIFFYLQRKTQKQDNQDHNGPRP